MDKMDSMFIATTAKTSTGGMNEDISAQMAYKSGGNTFGWGPKSNYTPGGGGVSYMQHKRKNVTLTPAPLTGATQMPLYLPRPQPRMVQGVTAIE